MAGLPYNCRCFTVTGAVAGIPNPSATGNNGGSSRVGDKSNPNPPLGVALPSGATALCKTNVIVPAGTPFLVLATGAGGGGGSNGNYGAHEARSCLMTEVTGGAGGSGQPLCAYFYAKDYAVTLSAQCGVGGGGASGRGCTQSASGGNGGDGTPTIVTIGTQTVLLLPGKGGTGGSGGVDIPCAYIPPVPLGGYGWKSGGEGTIVKAPCSPALGNCWTTNRVGISPVPQLAVGGASIFGLGGAQSTGCSFYPNNGPASGAGGSGGGGAHFVNCGSASGDGYPARGGGNGVAYVILNPSNATLQAYGLLS